MNIGFDAKRIVRNGSGLGNYGRTLVNDLAEIVDDDTRLLLYAPDEGREELRSQVHPSDNLRFVYPQKVLVKSLWRSRGIIKDLQRDHIDIFHGLSGELPIGIHAAGIKSVVTIHDLIFMRHPEYYHWWDVKIYTAKFHKSVKEADRIIAISECTKRDIVELGGVNPDKIEVIYQSCDTHFHHPANEDTGRACAGGAEGRLDTDRNLFHQLSRQQGEELQRLCDRLCADKEAEDRAGEPELRHHHRQADPAAVFL